MFDLCFLCLQRLGHSVGSYQRYAFVAESVGAMTNHTPPPPTKKPNLHPNHHPYLYSFIHSSLKMFQCFIDLCVYSSVCMACHCTAAIHNHVNIVQCVLFVNTNFYYLLQMYTSGNLNFHLRQTVILTRFILCTLLTRPVTHRRPTVTERRELSAPRAGSPNPWTLYSDRPPPSPPLMPAQDTTGPG